VVKKFAIEQMVKPLDGDVQLRRRFCRGVAILCRSNRPIHRLEFSQSFRGQVLCTCFRAARISGKLRKYPAMKPYPVLSSQVPVRAVFLLCFLAGLVVNTFLVSPQILNASAPAVSATPYRAADDPQV